MQPVQVQDFDSYLGKYEASKIFCHVQKPLTWVLKWEQSLLHILNRYVGQEAILALLLDYDGTLSPIAPHPDLATIPPETKKVLAKHQS